MHPRRRSFAAGAGAMVGTAVLVAILLRLGHGPLAPPSHWSVPGIRAWATGRDPVTAGLSVLRLVALGTATHLGLTTGLAASARLLHAPTLGRASHLLAIPGTRGLIRNLAGLSLGLSTLVSPGPAGVPRAGAPVVLERVDAPVTTAAVLTRIDDAPGPTATLTELDPTPAPTRPTGPVTVLSSATPAPAAIASPSPPPSPSRPSSPPGAWLVRHGDHLWSISATTLEQAWHRTPTEAQTDRYWRQVVRANPQITDPDLVFAGQRVSLPPPPPPPMPSAPTR